MCCVTGGQNKCQSHWDHIKVTELIIFELLYCNKIETKKSMELVMGEI